MLASLLFFLITWLKLSLHHTELCLNKDGLVRQWQAGLRIPQLRIYINQTEIFAHGQAEEWRNGSVWTQLQSWTAAKQHSTCGLLPGTVKVRTTAVRLLRLQQTQMFLSPCPFSHSASLPSEAERRQSSLQFWAALFPQLLFSSPVSSDATKFYAHSVDSLERRKKGFPNSSVRSEICSHFQMKVITSGSSPLRVCVFLMLSDAPHFSSDHPWLKHSRLMWRRGRKAPPASLFSWTCTDQSEATLITYRKSSDQQSDRSTLSLSPTAKSYKLFFSFSNCSVLFAYLKVRKTLLQSFLLNSQQGQLSLN